MSKPPAAKLASAPKPKRRQHNGPLIVGGVMACLTTVVVGAAWVLTSGSTQPKALPIAQQDAAQIPATKPIAVPTEPQTASNQPPASDQSPLIDDDGKSLWVSPTDGKPLDLGYLSPGSQIIVTMRPAALLKHPEGEKVRAALGPVAQAGIEFVESSTGTSLADMERLIVGCQAKSDGQWHSMLVVHGLKPFTSETLLARLPGAVEKEHFGKKYWLAGDRAYYLPGGKDANVLVVAPEDAIHDVIDLGGQTPPLRRDIERLIAHTDTDRQLTIIVAPKSLFNEGQNIFSGEMTRLRGPLFNFLGDELSGAALSLHWDDNFFLELIATPTLETLPERAAGIFTERVRQVPDKLEEYVVGLNAQPYGRLVLARFPEMVRKLTSYTRSSFERDHVVLRSYLPAVAGHNLLLAGVLTLAESPSTAKPPGEATSVAVSAAPTAPATVQERLAKVTSLKFAKDTLEAALEQLSQDIGAPIVIRGPDLQADGITKNQSFGIDISDKPAEQILVEILKLANPDKTSPGPTDLRQKLVYIIEQKPDKTEQVVITTRAKAKDRKDELPAAFRTEK